MKKTPWMILSVLVAAAVPWAACGSSSSGTTSDNGNGGSGGSSATTNPGSTSTHGSTTTTATAGPVGSTSSGGPTTCEPLGFGDPCDSCLTSSCCDAVKACEGDTNCSSCLDGTLDSTSAECMDATTSGLASAVVSCAQASCAQECGLADTCNPVTNEGCDSAGGEACDVGSSGFFTCFPSPNTAKECAACDNSNGPFCAAGGTCLLTGSTCQHYCCDDTDCGTGDTCDTSGFAGGLADSSDLVGVCVPKTDGGAGACSAPAVSPTKGSCVGGFKSTN